MKKCSRKDCENKRVNKEGLLPLEEFSKNKSRKDGLHHACKECDRKRDEERRRDPNFVTEQRNFKYQKNYGISLSDYEELFDKQKGKCALCGNGVTQGSRMQNLSVDHCHITGKIRGLLCIPCNRALGKLGLDKKENLKKLEEYLGFNEPGSSNG